jgi:hypothetical protein
MIQKREEHGKIDENCDYSDKGPRLSGMVSAGGESLGYGGKVAG